MYFFECKLKKQRAILLKIMPDITAVIEFIGRMESKRRGGEKARLAREANNFSKQADAAAAEVADRDDEEASEIRARARIAKAGATDALNAAEAEAAENGVKIIQEAIITLLNEQYDGVLRVIAALYGTEAAKLEEEKTLFDLADMIREAITDERLMGFFPQLRAYAKKTRPATRRK